MSSSHNSLSVHLSVEGTSAPRGPLSPTSTYSTHQTPLGSPLAPKGNIASNAKPNVFFPSSPVVTNSSLSAAAASQSALVNSSTTHNPPSSMKKTASSSVLDQAAQVMALANQEQQMRVEDSKFELHPRLAYSCAELQRQTFVFLNERTLLFPVGLHLFKYDVGAQTIAAAALSAATAAAALASGELKAAPSVVAAPLPGVAIVAPDAGANNAATACMEFFFKRSYSVTPLLAISRNRARLAIAEDMESSGGSHSISSTAVAHHTRGHSAHQAAAGLSGSYRKAMISIIDLTADPPVLCWQFHHAHAGKLKSLDFSANGNLLAACIELDQSEPVAGNHARRRNKDADSSRPGTGEDSQQETERSENGGWHEEKATEPDEHETPIHLQKSVSAVTVWRVDTHKFLATHTSDHMMHSVAINPDDNYLMVASGNKYIRYLKTVGTQLDEIPFLKRLLERTYHFSQHAWIDASILAALTEENEVLIFQKGQLKQVLAHQLSPATDKIISLTPYRDSFFLGSQDGTLTQVIPAKNAGGGPAVSAAAQLAAEKEREKEKSGAVQQAKLFKVNNEFQTHKGAISEMVISPNDGTMVVSVRDHGLSTFPMDLMGRWSEFETEPELTDVYLPCGDIVAMDACEQRSIVVTAATDHTVSIWSHLKHSPRASPCAIRHTFNEVPLAVAFHPSGYQLLVGFATHIGMFHLLRNSLKLSYSFQLYTRTVTPLLIKYSHGGERFAVATGVHLFVYSSVDFSLLQHIPGNSGIINAFEWSSDDTVLSCVNGEGAIYAWELKTLQRVFDHVEKGVEFHAMCLDWGKNWRKQTYQSLHHGISDSAGNRAITAAMKADGIDDAGPAAEGTENSDGNQPQVDRCQVLAAGATFTSYRLKTLTAAGIQDVKAKDFTNAAMNLNGEGEELALERISITHLIRDAQRNIILAGTSTGYVLIFRWPFVTKARDSMDVALGLAQHGVLDPAHANVLGKFLVHEGSIQHMVYLPMSGVLLTYGMDGNFFVLDLRVIDLKSFLTTAAGQALAKAVPQDRKRQAMLAQVEEEAQAALMPITAEKKTRANALSVIHAQHRSYKLNRLTTIMLPKSLSNKKFEYQQHSYYGDSDLVLVKNSEYESILQEIRENSQDVRRMERTAEYQMSAQKDFYVQSLKTLRNDMESLLQSRENELSTTKNLLKLSESEKNSQSNQHKTDILELNTSWRTTLEKKMHESYLAMEKKTKEMNELDQMHIQEKKDLVAAHAKRVEDLRQEHKNQVSDLTNRVAELEVALKDSEQQYEEALTQLESEHDTQVVGLQRSSAAQRLKTREGTAILQAEVSAAKRKLEEKNDSLKALESVNNEKEDQLQHLAGVVRRLTQEMQQCKVQLREKEENITRRQHELAQARQDNGTLKNFLEILEHRIAELENRETPALETMIALKNQVESMSEELFELNKQKLLAQTLAERKQGESTRFSITANNLRHKLAKKEHAWENVQKELKYIVEHLGHSFQGTTKALPAGSGGSSSGSSLSSGSINLHQDLKNLYTNYFSSSAKETEQPDRSLIEKVENEATRQRVFLEKSLKRLRNANASIAARTKADGERALAHNINFLLEVNRLREENSRLFMRCGLYRSMVVQAGLGRKLDMIDSGEEGAAMALIEEEQKQAAAQNPKNATAGNKRLMSSNDAELNSPPQQRPNAYAPTPSPSTSSQKLLQSAGDNLHSPVPLYGLASQASKDAILSGSQSSATLPSLPGSRTMKESQSTPALPFVSEGGDGGGDLSRSGSAASISRIGGPRGKDALAIEGGAARAAREAAEAEARRSAGRFPVRGSTPSKGTTKAIAENSALKVKANELERRLEAVTNHASLQAVHISALQGAIRTAQEHASRGSELLNAGESFDGVPDVDEEDEEGEEGDLDDDGEERFFGIGNRPPSSASGNRPVSRGRLSPLRTSHGSPSLGASASTPSLSLAGTSTGTSSAALRGQNAATTTAGKGLTLSSKVPPHGTLQPIDQSFHSIQANIESTLQSGSASGSAKSSGRNSAKSGGIAAALDSATKNANARKIAKAK